MPLARYEQLIIDLSNAFGYTGDNNRDILGDELFSIQEVMEELEVEKAYQFLIAYISRNREAVETALQEDS